MTKFLTIAITCFVLANCACGNGGRSGEPRDESAEAAAAQPGNAKTHRDVCDAKRCPQGCCNEAGECNSYVQQTKSVCGSSGERCTQCPQDALSCTVGHCVVDESCLEYCNDGCCTEQGVCMPFAEQSPVACGAASLCATCGPDQQCAEGECTPESVWLIIIRSVRIADKKGDGRHWDTSDAGGRLPDPYVQSGLNSDSLAFPEGETHHAEDTLMPTWSPKLQSNYFHTERSLLKNGLRFRIRDSDVGPDETISECDISVSLADLGAGSKRISTCGMSGLAMDLRVDFRSQR
ncbi:MAG: hypothetical protein JKY56_17490 [Kofleriaceae bacterium]|nr:hypothetical protein [Kofleriaceae bacterium]